MMQRFLFAFFVVLTVCSSLVQAQSYPTRQDLYVNDLGHVLSRSEEDELRALVRTISADFDLTVLTVGGIVDYDPSEPSIETFSTNVFNNWQIGDQASNKGILVVLAMRNRDVRIEVGDGYGREYDDDMKAVIEEYMIPRFKEDDYAQGLIDGVAQIYREITGQLPTVAGVPYQLPTPVKSTSSSSAFSSSSKSNPMLPVAALGFGIVFLMGPGARAWRRYQKSRARTCSKCRSSMVRLDEVAGEAHLDEGQRLERKLGSVPHEVWECPRCQTHSISSEAPIRSKYSKCPQCHYRTEELTSNLTKVPTASTMGVRQAKSECHHCGRQKEWTEPVAFVRQTTYASASDRHKRNTFHDTRASSFGHSSSFHHDHDSHHSDGGFDQGSSSGGGSSDDGGSSSGGGASGSW